MSDAPESLVRRLVREPSERTESTPISPSPVGNTFPRFRAITACFPAFRPILLPSFRALRMAAWCDRASAGQGQK